MTPSVSTFLNPELLAKAALYRKLTEALVGQLPAALHGRFSVCGINNRQLVVAADSPHLTPMLRFHQNNLLRIANTMLALTGSDILRALQLSISTPSAIVADRRSILAHSHPAPRFTAQQAQALVEVANRTQSPDLQRALLKLASRRVPP